MAGRFLITYHLGSSNAAAAAKSLQSCPTLCDPIDGSPPGSSVPGILQARILEWVAIFFSNACMHAKSLQPCPTLCDPMDCSPPGSSVPGILQARILEWVAMPSSRGSSQPRGQTCISYVSCIGRRVLYHCRHLGYALESSQTHPPHPGSGKKIVFHGISPWCQKVWGLLL